VTRPNLFIVGAAKCGTTSLYHYLSQHPGVFMSHIKEPHHFSDLRPDAEVASFYRSVDDPEDYLRLFEGAGACDVIGEASTSYFTDARAAERIRQFNPDARIIIMLRDPVERAYSHYLNNVREGLETEDFETALRRELGSPAEALVWGRLPLYLAIGRYEEGLNRFLTRFPGRCFVMLFEEFREDLVSSLERTVEFLDLPHHDWSAADLAPRNVASEPRGALVGRILRSQRARDIGRALFPSRLRPGIHRIMVRPARKAPMPETARALLREAYATSGARVAEILGRPVRGWQV